jgi:NAD(P)-dependent dehydrogenase (short-subunit alcohol dehydrogenase family)
LGTIPFKFDVGANKVVHPDTGLWSGFLRSLSRELPAAACKQVNTSDGDLAAALALYQAELALGRPDQVEVSYFGNRRHVSSLVEADPPVAGPPLLQPESVVIAVGGARGITAILAEAVLRRFGCTLVLVGRTDPEAVPGDLLSLDDDAFERFEAEFYSRELATGRGARMGDLKKQYDSYRSAREAAANIRRLRTLPGSVKYLRADICDAVAVESVVRQVAAETGRLDLVIYGAGIQVSKVLARKSLEDFRGIVATKLGGLANVMRACQRQFADRRIHFHCVTSAFSQIGNAGQQDYGAANIAMDRIAQCIAAGPGPWEASSLGWLGWYKLGMTKGSEYATLAVLKKLRPIPGAEGAALFETFLSGRPVSPTLHLMSDLESTAFQLPVRKAEASQPPAPRTLEQSWSLSPETHPFLRDHLLNGVPTLPGAFAVELAVRLARAFRPALHVQHLENIEITRFIKFSDGRPFVLRAIAEALEEQEGTARIRVTFLSDFVHSNGQVLQSDIVHFTAELLLTSEALPVASRGPVPAVAWTAGSARSARSASRRALLTPSTSPCASRPRSSQSAPSSSLPATSSSQQT